MATKAKTKAGRAAERKSTCSQAANRKGEAREASPSAIEVLEPEVQKDDVPTATIRVAGPIETGTAHPMQRPPPPDAASAKGGGAARKAGSHGNA